MPLSDYQLSYNGLTIGDGTNFPLFNITGLDAPDTRDQDQDRYDSDGAVPGRDLMSKRHVVVELDFAESTDALFETRLAELRAAFVRRINPTDELPLVFKLPGQAEKRHNCRPRKRRIPVDQRFTFKNPNVVIEFVGSDPRLYTETETTTSWTADGTTQVLNNTGNVYSYPVVEIVATATSPLTIINDTLSRQIKINQTVSAGTLIVDLHKRTVKGDDGNDYYTNVDTTTKWWGLAPGNNSIRIVTNGTGTRRVKWRSAWDGI